MILNRIFILRTTVLTINLIAGQTLTLLYTVLGTRYFLPPEYGKIATGIALSMIVTTLADFGFSQEVLRKQILNSDFKFVISLNRFLRFLAMSMSLMIILAIVDFHSYIFFLPVIGLSWYISVLAAIPFRADSNFMRLTIASALGRAVGFSLAVAILEIYVNKIIYFFGFASLYFFEGLFLYMFGRKKYGVKMNYILKPRIENSLASVLPIIQSFDVVAIRIASPLAAGLFSAVNKWPAALGSLVTALNLTSYKTHVKPENGERRWQFDFIPFYFVTLALSVSALVFSSKIVEILLPDNYSESLNIFRILIFVTLVSFWNQVYFSRFIATGYHKSLNFIYTFWTILQIIILFLVTKYFYLETALRGIFLVQIFMLISFIYSDGKHKK